MAGFKMKVTPEIENLTEVCKEHSSLDLSLYQKYELSEGFVTSMVRAFWQV